MAIRTNQQIAFDAILLMSQKKKTQPYTSDILLDVQDADVIIKYPLRETEFDVHAELYHRLKRYCEEVAYGLEIKSEVTAYIDGKVQMRFDLMLFRHCEPICGIEVKRDDFVEKTSDQFKTQQTKYKMFKRVTGIPVYYCYGCNQIEETLNKVKRCL